MISENRKPLLEKHAGLYRPRLVINERIKLHAKLDLGALNQS